MTTPDAPVVHGWWIAGRHGICDRPRESAARCPDCRRAPGGPDHTDPTETTRPERTRK